MLRKIFSSLSPMNGVVLCSCKYLTLSKRLLLLARCTMVTITITTPTIHNIVYESTFIKFLWINCFFFFLLFLNIVFPNIVVGVVGVVAVAVAVVFAVYVCNNIQIDFNRYFTTKYFTKNGNQVSLSKIFYFSFSFFFLFSIAKAVICFVVCCLNRHLWQQQKKWHSLYLPFGEKIKPKINYTFFSPFIYYHFFSVSFFVFVFYSLLLQWKFFKHTLKF